MSLRTMTRDGRADRDRDRGGRARPAHRRRADPATTCSGGGESVGFFWTPAKTQLYAILRKLVANGFATARHVRQADRPDKTLYRITAAGEERLRDGLEQVGSTVNKNPLELRIFFGEHRPLEAVVADLEAVRDQQRAHLEELEEIERHVRPRRDLFPYLTLLRGKANARADAAWAEQALELLAQPAMIALAVLVLVALASVFVPSAAPARDAGRSGTTGRSGSARRGVQRHAEARCEPNRHGHARPGARRARASAAQAQPRQALRFSAPGLPKPIVFQLKAKGKKLSGTATQGAAHATVSLTRGRRAPTRASGTSRRRASRSHVSRCTASRHNRSSSTWRRASSPQRRPLSATRLAVRQYDVRFPNGKTTLTGTLTVPPGAAPHPGVVYVSGSGATLREESHWLDSLFISRGIAVLAYDKRGVGQSGGAYPGDLASAETIATLAGDAAAAARFLAAQAGIDRSRVGFYGLSQGGWIIPQATVRSGGAVSWALIQSGPTVTQGESDTYASFAETLPIPEAERRAHALGPSGYDPVPWIRRLTIPVLWLYAGRDLAQPTGTSMDILRGLSGRARLHDSSCSRKRRIRCSTRRDFRLSSSRPRRTGCRSTGSPSTGRRAPAASYDEPASKWVARS